VVKRLSEMPWTKEKRSRGYRRGITSGHAEKRQARDYFANHLGMSISEANAHTSA
jgi:hypothetical protein